MVLSTVGVLSKLCLKQILQAILQSHSLAHQLIFESYHVHYGPILLHHLELTDGKLKR